MDFDLEKIKLSQDFSLDLGVKKVLVTVPIKKPDKQWFIRVHPNEEYRISIAVIELKEDRETYLVDPSLWEELQAEIIPKVILYCINRQGDIFLWPVRLPGIDGKIDEWNRSALEASKYAKDSWCRVTANMSLGAYEVLRAVNNEIEPKWPEKSFEEIFKIAFRDKFITSLDHIVIKRLRGAQ